MAKLNSLIETQLNIRADRFVDEMRIKYYGILLTDTNIRMLIKESYLAGWRAHGTEKEEESFVDIDYLWRGYKF